MTTLVWREPDGTGRCSNTKDAHKAEIGNVIYCAKKYGHVWYAFLRAPDRLYDLRGLGEHDTLEAAKQACEKHLADGCHVGRCFYRVRLS